MWIYNPGHKANYAKRSQGLSWRHSSDHTSRQGARHCWHHPWRWHDSIKIWFRSKQFKGSTAGACTWDRPHPEHSWSNHRVYGIQEYPLNTRQSCNHITNGTTSKYDFSLQNGAWECHNLLNCHCHTNCHLWKNVYHPRNWGLFTLCRVKFGLGNIKLLDKTNCTQNTYMYQTKLPVLFLYSTNT